MIKEINRKSMIIRPSGRSTDFISPSFGHGCLYNCSYCYMKRHKHKGLDIAKNTMDILTEKGISIDAMRVKGFPFAAGIEDFIDQHEQVFVIEQNRDAQFRSLLVNELEINPKKLLRVSNYDGMPITADCILSQMLPKIKLEAHEIHAHNKSVNYDL